MKLLIALPLMISTSVFAADWHKFTVEPEFMQLSHDVTYCMAQKTINVLEGTEHTFAERFYKKCIIIHGKRQQQYSRKFRVNTIARFHYVLKRMEALSRSMKA